MGRQERNKREKRVIQGKTIFKENKTWRQISSKQFNHFIIFVLL